MKNAHEPIALCFCLMNLRPYIWVGECVATSATCESGNMELRWKFRMLCGKPTGCISISMDNALQQSTDFIDRHIVLFKVINAFVGVKM